MKRTTLHLIFILVKPFFSHYVLIQHYTTFKHPTPKKLFCLLVSICSIFLAVSGANATTWHAQTTGSDGWHSTPAGVCEEHRSSQEHARNSTTDNPVDYTCRESSLKPSGQGRYVLLCHFRKTGRWCGTLVYYTQLKSCDPGQIPSTNNRCAQGPQNAGPQQCAAGAAPSPMVGNPINAIVGNKHQSVEDFSTQGHSNLKLIRYYNSLYPRATYHGSLGRHWQHNYERSITLATDPESVWINVLRPGGRQILFTKSGIRG